MFCFDDDNKWENEFKLDIDIGIFDKKNTRYVKCLYPKCQQTILEFPSGFAKNAIMNILEFIPLRKYCSDHRCRHCGKHTPGTIWFFNYEVCSRNCFDKIIKVIYNRNIISKYDSKGRRRLVFNKKKY